MYITQLVLTVGPETAHEKVISLPTTVIQEWNPTSTQTIKELVSVLAFEYALEVNWSTFTHDEETRVGKASLHEPAQSDDCLMFATWSYTELDDPDLAELLELPVDLHRDVVGVLTPQSQAAFWSCVNQELEPMEFLDDTLRRFGMTPAEHDQADHVVMKHVLALQWWRAFPTITAGQSAIDSQPNLTSQVIDQINTMALRCYVDGENYDLYTTLVH